MVVARLRAEPSDRHGVTMDRPAAAVTYSTPSASAPAAPWTMLCASPEACDST